MGNQTYFVTDRDLRWPLVQVPLQDRLRATESQLQEGHIGELQQRFGGLVVKEKSGSNTPQFLLQVNHLDQRDEILDTTEKHYRSPFELQQEKPFTLQLESLIRDENGQRQGLFIGRQNGRYVSLVLTPFQRFDEVLFKDIVYEHYMNRFISGQRHKNLHNTLDSYFLSSGQQRLGNDIVSVTIKEEVAASLAEINNYRRTNNWPWTEMQLQLLIYHCLSGLDALHSQFISHGDIRPSNIFYSVSKHAYVLGSFGYSAKHLSFEERSSFANKVSYYQSPEAKSHSAGHPQRKVFNPFKNDVYALGMTLLSSFFLATPKNSDVLIASARANLRNSEAILKLLGMMVLPEDERPTARQLMDLVRNRGLNNYRSFNREDTLIESLRYKRIANEQDAEAERRSIAQCYQNLFMAENALQTNTELLHLYQVRNDRLQQANYHMKIAEHSHNHEQSQQSYEQATRLYWQIAQNHLKEHRLDQSIYYYNKAITACERRPGNEHELAQLLKEISKAYNEKSAYDLSKTFLTEALNLVERSKGRNSFEYVNMLVELAKVESEFQEYKAAENYLKSAVKVTEAHENEGNPDVGAVRAQILEALGNNLRLKSTTGSDKQSHYRQKAEQCLQQAFALNSNLPNNDLKLASNHENLGHLYFDRGQFGRALKSYQAALLLRKHSAETSIATGQTLTYIANCNKYLKDHERAISNYNDALEIFRKEIGNNHNQYTAVAIGNLGLVYKDIGRDVDAREYLNIAQGILRDLYGQNSPDYLYFRKRS